MKAGGQLAIDFIMFTVSMQVLAEKKILQEPTNESAGVSTTLFSVMNEWASRMTKE